MAGKSCKPSHDPPQNRRRAPVTLIYYIYSRKIGKGRGDNPETMLERRMAVKQTRGIHAHVDNIRPLTAQAYQRWLQAFTVAGARTNNAKCRGAQTPVACTGASDSQNTVGHDGTLTLYTKFMEILKTNLFFAHLIERVVNRYITGTLSY